MRQLSTKRCSALFRVETIDTGTGFEPVQNVSFALVAWRHTVTITGWDATNFDQKYDINN